ncbi:MAG: PepSY domain-containing protein [Planctomycetaceae bacterium]|nr:PepSY domain-containing protein [Planctomycetaceae bacterium]
MKQANLVRGVAAALCVCLWLGVSAAGESRGTLLSYDQALEIAMNLLGGAGTVTESDIDHKRSGRVIYEFDIESDDYEYEVEIDGYTGDVLQYKQERAKGRRGKTAGLRLDARTVQEMARNQAGGGNVVKYEVERDDGRVIHEITVVDGATRHKMEIDDATGEVVEYSRKR